MSEPDRKRPLFEAVAGGVLDSLLEGCQVIGFDFRYLYVNDAVARQGRRSRDGLLGRTMMECYPGIDRTPMFEVLRRCMTARTHERMENEFTHLDGSKGWFDLRFLPVPDGVCILSLDATEDRRAREALQHTEQQLRQAQKMEAIGRLAGGVAHDFNNLLSVILCCAEMALTDLPLDEPLRDDLEEIRKAGHRATDLTRQLLAFSRRQVVEPRVVDLNEVLASMNRLLQRILGADIDLVARHSATLGRVCVDRGSIEQVIMNLAVNSRDAMPAGGQLTLETADVVLDEAYARDHLGVTPGPHVMIAVTDTGTGMDRATLEHIFEPFFTTKEKGKGTGLGLATVFGIVQQAGGSVWVYSEPGKGTTFKVYLPRVEGETDAPRPSATPTSLRGTETILLVEDDDQVRAVARDILMRAGYGVIDARNAGEALLHSEQHPERIHLLLSDVVMPQMSGPDLASRLAKARPDIKVLCMSGYADDAVVRHGVVDAGVAYLQKPITPAVLTSRVREVLDE